MFGHATYLVLLVVWAVPVVALHWAVGGRVLWVHRRQIALATVLGGGYLSVADRVALGDGIWEIHPARSTGIMVAGLPLEELIFFLVTSLMVAQSVVLLTSPDVSVSSVLDRLRAVPRHLTEQRINLYETYRHGLAWGSLGAVSGSLVALAQGANSPLTAPALLIMDLTPVPIASWLLERLGSLAGSFGLLGGFAGYLGIAGVLALGMRGGWSGRLLAVTGAGLLATWLASASSSLAGLVAGGAPLLAGWRQTVSTPTPGRRRFLAAAPVLAALALAGVWSLARATRDLRSAGAGSLLFAPPPTLPRTSGFPVPGQAPEVTTASAFYVVSKNAEDPGVDPGLWRLRVTGLVESPLELDLDALLALPRSDAYVTLACVSNPVGGALMGNGLWSGVRLADLLAPARPRPDAAWVRCAGRDGHNESLPLAELEADGALIAFALNGALLERNRGYPARLIAPGRYGFKHVKWLEEIQLAPESVPGHWSGRGWTALAPIRTTARIDVVQPHPDAILVAGVALAGTRGIQRVEVRHHTPAAIGPWNEADLHQPPLGNATWVQWRVVLPHPAGDGGTVEARAWDGLGVMQDTQVESAFPKGASGLHARAVRT